MVENGRKRDEKWQKTSRKWWEMVENWMKNDRKLEFKWQKAGQKILDNWQKKGRKMVENWLKNSKKLRPLKLILYSKQISNIFSFIQHK